MGPLEAAGVCSRFLIAQLSTDDKDLLCSRDGPPLARQIRLREAGGSQTRTALGRQFPSHTTHSNSHTTPTEPGLPGPMYLVYLCMYRHSEVASTYRISCGPRTRHLSDAEQAAFWAGRIDTGRRLFFWACILKPTSSRPASDQWPVARCPDEGVAPELRGVRSLAKGTCFPASLPHQPPFLVSPRFPHG